jgi:hypothetical protein
MERSPSKTNKSVGGEEEEEVVAEPVEVVVPHELAKNYGVLLVFRDAIIKCKQGLKEQRVKLARMKGEQVLQRKEFVDKQASQFEDQLKQFEEQLKQFKQQQALKFEEFKSSLQEQEQSEELFKEQQVFELKQIEDNQAFQLKRLKDLHAFQLKVFDCEQATQLKVVQDEQERLAADMENAMVEVDSGSKGLAQIIADVRRECQLPPSDLASVSTTSPKGSKLPLFATPRSGAAASSDATSPAYGMLNLSPQPLTSNKVAPQSQGKREVPPEAKRECFARHNNTRLTLDNRFETRHASATDQG